MSARQIASGDMLPYPLGWPSSSYRLPDNASAFTSSAVSTSALATFLPFLVPRAVTLTKIGLHLVTAQAGAECRLGLYADDNGAPGSLLFDAGILDLSSGGGAFKEATINLPQAPGMIWSCCQMKNVATQATVIRMSAGLGGFIPQTAALLAVVTVPRYYQQSITYGSVLPSPAGVVASAAGTDCPVIMLRN